MRLALGPLSASLDGLALRWLRWRDVELLRGVAFVMRDAAWGTHVPTVTDMVVAGDADGFSITVQATLPAIQCTLRIAFTPDGITLDGSARATAPFETNRTGFVLLHGEDCAARPVTVEHTDGRVTQGRFPDLISPHQPFLDMRAVTHCPADGLRVRVAMTGDTFEMEDHRNWSDAGFKTYCRPLALPHPFAIEAGEALAQRIDISIGADAAASAAAPPGASGPAIALAAPPRLARAAPAAQAGSLPDDVALLVAATETGRDLATFAHRLAQTGAAGAVLLTGAGDRAEQIAAIAGAVHIEALLIADATPAALAAARAAMPHARIGAGSAQHFAEFNRTPPPAGADFVFWPVSATVHATDDASVLETLRVLPDQARTARALCPGLPLWVGPVRIGSGWEADPRDAGPLGATFLAGHLAAWAAAGVDTMIVLAGTPLPETGQP